MPSFPTIDLTIEDFAGLLGGDKDKIQQPPVQNDDAVPAASVPGPGAGGGQVPDVNINLQLPLRPAFPQGRRTSMFTVKPGFTPINRSEASGSLRAKFRTTADAMPFSAPSQPGDLSTASRFEPVKTTNVFDFNAPMEPVSRNPSQLDHIRSPPAFDFNTPLRPVTREALQPDPVRDLPVPATNIPEPSVEEPARPAASDQVPAEEPQVRSCQTKNWICSSTIQIRDHVSALEFANDLCQSKDVGVADNKLVVWTDGSGQHNNTATSAAIVYRQPLPDPGPSCWVARGFGIMGYAGGAMLAESVAVAVALEAALDLWITLNNKRGQLGPRSHAGPAPIWIKQLTPSQPARPPVPRRPLPFSFIDLTVDDGPAVEVIDLTGDDSDDSMTEVLPAPTPVAEKEPVTESVKPFQELHILCDAQSVLTSSLMGIVRRKSATWDFISARVKGLMQQLFEKGVVVHFHWVPGHSGIEGNERADHVCGVVNKAMMRMPTRAPGQRVWEIEGLSESFAQGPGFNPQLCNVKRRRHFEMKQRKAISKWSLRPALRKQQREDLREVRRRYRKRNKHIGPVAPDEETVRHGEPQATEERASGLGMQLRRSARLAAGLIAKESGNTMANAIEIID